MASAVSALDLPFDEAIAFLREKAAVPTESWRDVWDAAHAKSFMVAGANTVALVEDFQEAIAKALEQGTTLETFRGDFDAIVKKHGWSYRGERGWRTRTIFETNMRTAYAAGRYAQMTAPDTLSAFPYWQYNHSGALHPRLDHKALDGQVFAADDPAWSVMYPPNGFGCGCFVTPVSRAELRRRGKAGPDTMPDLDQLGTDQPRGVDPSFAYNPGMAWLQQTAPGPVAVSASEATVAAFVRSALRGKWPDGSWTPVAVTSKAQAALLDVPAGTEVRLSADTIRSHVKHAIATPDAYGVLPKWLAEHGELIQDADGRWSMVGEHEGQAYLAAVKIVRREKRTEIYLTSLRRTNKDQLRRLKGR
ncbi:phage head morphogenesis protein [Shinella pollutisoli]|uniref:Phage head morphogenesis protein n=1 Tax=Shinella pollutisoli TaxID=2250594 RepID=A0ABV7DIA9_9HYPH|nr:phage head morphogenesis protein [Shinella pollutisoli]